MNSFTVICLYPEYATEDFGTATLLRTVEARHAFEASQRAQFMAALDAGMQIHQANDQQVIVMFPGMIQSSYMQTNQAACGYNARAAEMPRR